MLSVIFDFGFFVVIFVLLCCCEMVAILDEHGRIALASKFGFIILTALDIVLESNMVGNGAEAEMVAMLDKHGRIALASKFGFIIPSALDI